jgi:hypothetical protein
MPEIEAEPPISREDRLRRVVILCVAFMRNMAYFRGAYEAPEGWQSQAGELVLPDASFWVIVANNFLDVCVMEFCKLFVEERNGRHFWKRVVTDQETFKAELLAKLDMTEEAYVTYLESFKTYRDKFVAHLDDERTMYTPQLDAARIAVQHLHAWLVANECSAGLLDFEHASPERLAAGCKVEQSTARRIYSQVRAIGVPRR